jgi:hypothetical protein
MQSPSHADTVAGTAIKVANTKSDLRIVFRWKECLLVHVTRALDVARCVERLVALQDGMLTVRFSDKTNPLME